VHIGQNEGLRSPASPHERIQNDGFKEGEAQRVSGERDALPRMRRDHVDGRDTDGSLPPSAVEILPNAVASRARLSAMPS